MICNGQRGEARARACKSPSSDAGLVAVASWSSSGCTFPPLVLRGPANGTVAKLGATCQAGWALRSKGSLPFWARLDGWIWSASGSRALEPPPAPCPGAPGLVVFFASQRGVQWRYYCIYSGPLGVPSAVGGGPVPSGRRLARCQPAHVKRRSGRLRWVPRASARQPRSEPLSTSSTHRPAPPRTWPWTPGLQPRSRSLRGTRRRKPRDTGTGTALASLNRRHGPQ